MKTPRVSYQRYFSNRNHNDHVTPDVLVNCEQSPPSKNLSKNSSTSDMLSDNTPALTSSLSHLLVCPALNNGESDPLIAKRPPTSARLLTSNESLRVLEEKEQKKEAEALEKEKKKNERAAKKERE